MKYLYLLVSLVGLWMSLFVAVSSVQAGCSGGPITGAHSSNVCIPTNCDPDLDANCSCGKQCPNLFIEDCQANDCSSCLAIRMDNEGFDCGSRGRCNWNGGYSCPPPPTPTPACVRRVANTYYQCSGNTYQKVQTYNPTCGGQATVVTNIQSCTYGCTVNGCLSPTPCPKVIDDTYPQCNGNNLETIQKFHYCPGSPYQFAVTGSQACANGCDAGVNPNRCKGQPPPTAVPTATNAPTPTTALSCTPGSNKGQYCDNFTTPGSPFCVQVTWNNTCNGDVYTRGGNCCAAPPTPTTVVVPTSNPSGCGAGQTLIRGGGSCSDVSQCKNPYNWCNAGECTYCSGGGGGSCNPNCAGLKFTYNGKTYQGTAKDTDAPIIPVVPGNGVIQVADGSMLGCGLGGFERTTYFHFWNPSGAYGPLCYRDGDCTKETQGGNQFRIANSSNYANICRGTSTYNSCMDASPKLLANGLYTFQVNQSHERFDSGYCYIKMQIGNAAPTAKISGPISACFNKLQTFTVSAQRGGGSTVRTEVYYKGPTTNWTLIPAAARTSAAGTDLQPYTFQWAPPTAGSYQLVVNAYDTGKDVNSPDGKCSGNDVGGAGGWKLCDPTTRQDIVNLNSSDTGIVNGVYCPSSPTASFNPTSGTFCYEDPVTFQVNAAHGQGASTVKFEMYVQTSSGAVPADCVAGGGTIVNGYCRVVVVGPAGSYNGKTVTWKPLIPDTYRVLVAAYNDNVNYNSPAPYGGKCGSGGTAVDPNGTFDNCGTGVSTFTISKDGTCAKPWFKLSNAQFNSLTPQGNATRPNIIPFGMLPFDATDDTTDKYLIVNQGSNQGGSILTPGTGGIGIDLGPLATRHSTYDWYKTGYTFVPTPLYTPSVFLQYIKSRKTFRTISALDDSTFVSNGIYVWNGSMPLSVPGNTSFNGKNVVLYVPGDVSIGNLNPAGSVAIISSGTLSINSSATSIKGIYIAKSVHLDPSVQGLKVRGNISVVTDSANAGSGFSTARVNSNYQMPSLFMVFDPVMYINLLPYLSTDLYDYKQLQ